MNLNQKVVVITGGASGIGYAGTDAFSKRGASVVMLDVNRAAGEAAQQQFQAEGRDVRFLPCDISNEEEVISAFEEINAWYGKLDVLYNNASVFLGNHDNCVTELDSAIWHKVLSINLDGMFYCCKYGIPLMRKAGGGSIINTASSAGVSGVPGCDAYTATKGATISLTRSMAVEYGKENIRTNCIAPAAIATDMVKESNLNDADFDNEFFLKQITPLARWGASSEVAELACFLASDGGSYLNGTVIPCDGGITINGNVNKEIE